MKASNSLFPLLAAGLILLLGACAMNEAKLKEEGKPKLSEGELKALYMDGRVFSYRTQNGNGTVKFSGDGTMVNNSSTGMNDTGTWRIESDRFCAKYKVFFNGQERCASVYKVGDNKYVGVRHPSGEFTSEFSVAK